MNLQEKKMPIGFKQENALQIFGNGEGFVVIEEWETNDCVDLLGKVEISYEKFKQMVELHAEDLLNEAIGIKNV